MSCVLIVPCRTAWPAMTLAAEPESKARDAADSERLKKLKESSFEHEESDAGPGKDDGLDSVRRLIKSVEGKTFIVTDLGLHIAICSTPIKLKVTVTLIRQAVERPPSTGMI